MRIQDADIEAAAKDCLIKAGSTFRDDQIGAYRKMIANESNPNACWVMEQLLKNAEIAAREHVPLCDDTGIPHVIVQIGESCPLPPGWALAIQEGIASGLRKLPGRPMAVRGDDVQRVEQSRGLHADSEMLEVAPIITRCVTGDKLSLTVLLLGGGPEIRAKTRRIFHCRSIDHVLDEVAGWFTAEIGLLGCTPAVAAIGIGRSQVEASVLMLEAMAEGSLENQSDLEKKVTAAINASRVGPLGLGGDVTALGTFLKIGPTRASGVRIASIRPCCCIEPRRATITLGA